MNMPPHSLAEFDSLGSSMVLMKSGDSSVLASLFDSGLSVVCLEDTGGGGGWEVLAALVLADGRLGIVLAILAELSEARIGCFIPATVEELVA